jgi:NDP-sugar pyrophosphorylase family protein
MQALALVPLQSPYGVVELDGDSRVRGFVEKPKIKDRWINAGVYYFTQEVFQYLPENGNIEVTALPALAKEGRLKAVKYENIFWRSIDSHKDIEEAGKEMSHKQS